MKETKRIKNRVNDKNMKEIMPVTTERAFSTDVIGLCCIVKTRIWIELVQDHAQWRSLELAALNLRALLPEK
jgi:hypothetical protein